MERKSEQDNGFPACSLSGTRPSFERDDSNSSGRWERPASEALTGKAENVLIGVEK